jgi:hypothetical protein
MAKTYSIRGFINPVGAYTSTEGKTDTILVLYKESSYFYRNETLLVYLYSIPRGQLGFLETSTLQNPGILAGVSMLGQSPSFMPAKPMPANTSF